MSDGRPPETSAALPASGGLAWRALLPFGTAALLLLALLVAGLVGPRADRPAPYGEAPALASGNVLFQTPNRSLRGPRLGPRGTALSSAALTWPLPEAFFSQAPFRLKEGLDPKDSTSFLYDDPTAGGVPLMRVAGREEELLSPRLRVRDLAARDGASYARIAPELVSGLDRLMALAGAPLHVNSGYRHRLLNFASDVGGASRSQHMAGRAADLWGSAHTPVELAALALVAMGCDIGIGLGRDFIHVDVRGRRASWAQADAAMDEATFDRWVRYQCDGSPPPLFSMPADTLAADTTTLDSLVARRMADMAALAQEKLQKEERGIVVLELCAARIRQEGGPRCGLGFIPEESADIDALGARPLVQDYRPERSFVYAVINLDGKVNLGVAGYAGALPGASATPRPEAR